MKRKKMCQIVAFTLLTACLLSGCGKPSNDALGAVESTAETPIGDDIQDSSAVTDSLSTMCR